MNFLRDVREMLNFISARPIHISIHETGKWTETQNKYQLKPPDKIKLQTPG